MDIVSDGTSRQENTSFWHENYDRRSAVKVVTNSLAVLALIDVFISIPLMVLLFNKNVITDISSLLSCMYISCFVFMSIISAYLLLQSRDNFVDRIDAVGAWIVVHFINIVANICMTVFELSPSPGQIINKNILLVVLVVWKLVFILIEIIGSLYSIYITHNPVVYVRNPISRHPLFNSENTDENMVENAFDNPVHSNAGVCNTNPANLIVSPQSNQIHQRPISCISYPPTYLESQAELRTSNIPNNTQPHYHSYMSLALSNDSQLTRNPCYETEFSV